MKPLDRNKENILRKIYFLPSKNTALVIPFILVLGFVTGLLINTSILKNYILIVTVLMIYTTMIGFKIHEVFNFSQGKLMLTAIIINFTVIPLVGYSLGVIFLLRDPQLFAGLIITALLPTSNLTIAFTTMAKGNVPGAIKLTTVGLLLGALLAPLYLSLLLGKHLPINFWGTLKTISIVVLVPLAAGLITYKLLLRKYSIEKFQQGIKPYLPAASAWGMVFIVFTSVSMNSSIMVSQLRNFLLALFVQFIFLSINYGISVFVGRTLFDHESALSLVFGTALRNLSIAIGLAASSFGSNAALMVSLAFLIQPQAAAWFIKINRRFVLFPTKIKSISTKEKMNIGEV